MFYFKNFMFVSISNSQPTWSAQSLLVLIKLLNAKHVYRWMFFSRLNSYSFYIILFVLNSLLVFILELSTNNLDFKSGFHNDKWNLGALHSVLATYYLTNINFLPQDVFRAQVLGINFYGFMYALNFHSSGFCPHDCVFTTAMVRIRQC